MTPTVIILGILLLAALFVWAIYNNLVTAKVRVEQSWKDIDIQLKKRYDLLPDLVETAKKAAALDERVLTEVARLRADGMKAAESGAHPAERAKVEGQLTNLMRDVKIQVEAYPDIKAHQELSKLMDNVTDIEEKIAYARQFYNSNAGEYNTKIKLFPSVVLAGMLGFKDSEYFGASGAEKEDIKVNL